MEENRKGNRRQERLLGWDYRKPLEGSHEFKNLAVLKNAVHYKPIFIGLLKIGS